MRVVVVGAGGILAPAAAALAARGDEVTGIALSRAGIPAGVVPLAVDAREAAAFDGAAWDAGIVYLPAVTEPSLAALASAVAGRLVRVEVSAAADPVHGEPHPQPDVLLLGWADDDGASRWHTPAEVSSAAVAVLDDGAGRILGAVRPWDARP